MSLNSNDFCITNVNVITSVNELYGKLINSIFNFCLFGTKGYFSILQRVGFENVILKICLT